MKKVYMMVHELDVNKGGMTSSMFNRSREFYDANISDDIVTFDYKGNYDEIIKNLKNKVKWIQEQKCIMCLSILSKYPIANTLNLIDYYTNIFLID